MPQPRKHRDQAARQKAYRNRLKMRRSGREEKTKPVAGQPGQDPSDFVARVQQAGEDAIEEFFRR